MSSSLVETVNFDNGNIAEIHYDGDAEMPYRGDDSVKIVVLHRRYTDPSKGSVGDTADAVQKWCDKHASDWYTIPLWLYDHSGTAYAVGASNPFSCQWDSGRVGILAIERSEWGNGKEPDEKLFEYAKSVAEEYTNWANGECYGFILKNPEGEEVEACWGFIGRSSAIEEATAANTSRPAIVATAEPSLQPGA